MVSSSKYCANLVTMRELIGRDLALVEHGECFRGPLESIALNQGLVKFTCAWIAVRSENGEVNWRPPRTDNRSCSLQADQPYSVKGDGTIEFAIPYIGVAEIYPRGQNLDPATVPGLIQAATTD